jgi:hypothetical protein
LPDRRRRVGRDPALQHDARAVVRTHRHQYRSSMGLNG